MAFGNISLFIGSMLSAAFSAGVQTPEAHHALFFIGNGAYYEQSAQVSVNNAQWEPYANTGDLINNFIPDSILTDFTRALHEKEPNIFINTQLWNSFVRARKRVLQLFAHYSLHSPLEQLYVDNTTTLPTPLSNQLDTELMLENKGTHACNTAGENRITTWYHPLFFAFAATDTIKQLPIKQRLEMFKKNASILHPNFSALFHLLYALDTSAWSMYNTGNGLYYLALTENKTRINTSNFTQINITQALEQEITEPTTAEEFAWTQELEKIFNDSAHKWRIYISGHGSPMINSTQGQIEEQCENFNNVRHCSQAQIAGMPSNHFKNLLLFFNTKILTQRVVVSSCFVPAQRITQLLGEPLTFDLVTPISDYLEVKSFVPLIYTKHYVPEWLTANNTRTLEFQIHNSSDKTKTPNMVLKKFSVLLDTKSFSELKKHMRNLYNPQEQQIPAIVPAYK